MKANIKIQVYSVQTQTIYSVKLKNQYYKINYVLVKQLKNQISIILHLRLSNHRVKMLYKNQKKTKVFSSTNQIYSNSLNLE